MGEEAEDQDEEVVLHVDPGSVQGPCCSEGVSPRDKRILRVCGEDVASGSEKHITPEAAWMAKQGYKWTDSEEETIPATESGDEESFSA